MGGLRDKKIFKCSKNPSNRQHFTQNMNTDDGLKAIPKFNILFFFFKNPLLSKYTQWYLYREQMQSVFLQTMNHVAVSEYIPHTRGQEVQLLFCGVLQWISA